MAKGIYVGVGGVARKVRNIFVGVGGVARKVKAVYISVAGVIRKVFSTEIVYLGEGIVSLIYYDNAGGAVPNGGYTTSYGIIFRGQHAISDAFNASLVHFDVAIPIQSTFYIDNVSLGNYVICAGANAGGWGYGSNKAFAISDSLVKTDLANIPNAQFSASTFSFNGLAIFAGGYSYDALRYRTVITYNASLVRSSLPDLIYSISDAPCGSVGNSMAVIVSSQYTYLYNSSFVRTDILDQYNGYSAQGNGTTHVSTSTHVLIAGGILMNGSARTTNVVAFNASGVRSIAGQLPSHTYGGDKIGAVISDKAIIPYYLGDNNTTAVKYVISYDTSLVQTLLPSFTTWRNNYASTQVGDYALFGCSGDNGGPNTQIVDVYKG